MTDSPGLPSEEIAALQAELDRLEAAAPLSARETARYLAVESRLLDLEAAMIPGPDFLAESAKNSELPTEEALIDLLYDKKDAEFGLPTGHSDAARAVLALIRPAFEAKERERDEARQIVRDIYWMALRYADGRQSYAPGMCNDALRKAYDGGWLVHRQQSDPAFARDGSSPEYRSLEARALAAEAKLAQAVEAKVEIRRNDDGTIDEVVASGSSVHLEQLDKGSWYLGIYSAAGAAWQFWLSTDKPGRTGITINHEHSPARSAAASIRGE